MAQLPTGFMSCRLSNMKKLLLTIGILLASTFGFAQGGGQFGGGGGGGTVPSSPCGDATHALNWNGSAFGCQAITGAAAAGGGVNTIQYNQAGAIGGISQFTSNGTTTITGSATAVLDLHAAPATGLFLPGGLSTGIVTVTTATGAVSSFTPAAGVQTFLTTPSSANLITAVTDETGTGALVFGTAPTITLANGTGLPIATGVSGLAAGVAAFLATPSSANLITAVTDETGTGALVFGTAPTITLANGTGLPISTGVSGLAAGVATFLGTPTSANLATAVTNETGSGALVFGTSPTFSTGVTLGFITGIAAQCLHVDTSGVVTGTGSDCGAGGGSSAWSSLTNGSGNLSITTGGTSIFNTTTAVNQFFAFKNTTAAVVGTSQSSPVFSNCGTEFHAAASVEGCATFQFVPGTGTDAANTIAIAHTGSATGVTTTTFPGPASSTSDGVHAGAIFLTGNTTLPTGLPSNSVGFIGPNSASFTSYFLQIPATAPSGTQYLGCGTPASNVSTCTWGTTGGTVTSVGLTANSSSSSGIFTVTGSPVTTTGTLNINLAGTSGGLACFTSSTVLASSGALTANVLTKGGGAGVCPTNSLFTDDGTAVTYTGTGGVKSPVFTSTGTTAGFMDYPQGTTSVAVVPCSTATSICEQAPTAVTSYLVNKPGVSAAGTLIGTVASAVITQAFSGDANHSATVTTGSGTSIGSTSLCSTTFCPAGTYRVNVYIDITTACGTTGTYVVNLIYTDDQGSKTVPVNLEGTGSVPATGVLTTTSTANFGYDSFILRSTGGASINYSTTAVACGTAGPMVGKLYFSVEPLM